MHTGEVGGRVGCGAGGRDGDVLRCEGVLGGYGVEAIGADESIS